MQHPAYAQLRPVTESVGVILCPNPSYASLEGTNTWVIRAEGDPRSIIVDPGPQDEGHLNVLTRYAGDIALILLTHRHHDHADSIDRLRQLTGAPVRAVDPRYCMGAAPLQDGEWISVEGVTPQIEVVAAPGHTADSAVFFVHTGGEGTPVEGILTGDTIAGRHTTMISETDGDLGQYIKTLEMLEERGKGVTLMPGHGAELSDLSQMARKYIDRRYQRLDQVKAVQSKLGPDASINQIVDEIYTDVDPVLRGAAEQSTRVTLRYLAEHPDA